MTIFVIIVYLSLMLSFVGILRVIPFSKGNVNTIILRTILTVLNFISVFTFSTSVSVFAIVIIVCTILFVELSEFINRYISRKYVILISRNSFLLRLSYFLKFSTYSYGALVLGKAYPMLSSKTEGEAEKGLLLISAYLKKVKYDLHNISNCLIFLTGIDKKDEAYELLKSIPLDLTKKNISHTFIGLAVKLYCDNGEFKTAELLLEYSEEHYYDRQHKMVNLYIFLYYFSACGSGHYFNQLVKSFPTLLQTPDFQTLKNTLMMNAEKHLPVLMPKKYEFKMNILTNRKFISLYIFAGLICAVTILQLILADGGKVFQRIVSGDVNPLSYLKSGALAGHMLTGSNYIRLITPVFLHAGLLHLALNMFGLINLGRILYRFFDTIVFFTIFIIGAVAGNIFSVLFSGAALSIGASGGVFALLGALIVYFIVHRKDYNKNTFSRIALNFGIIIAIQIIFGLQNKNIDNFAHLGGFIGGGLTALLSLSIQNVKSKKRFQNVLKVFIFAICVFTLANLPLMLKQNPYSNFKLTKEITVGKLSYSIPDHWIKMDKNYIEPYANAQIVISEKRDEFFLVNHKDELINSYRENGHYLLIGESVVAKGFTRIEFKYTGTDADLNFYIFLNNVNKKIVEVYLWIPPENYREYEQFFMNVLASIK